MATFEVEYTDGMTAILKDQVENVGGYKDSPDGKWIDFLANTNSPGTTQMRRFKADRVIGITRVSD